MYLVRYLYEIKLSNLKNNQYIFFNTADVDHNFLLHQMRSFIESWRPWPNSPHSHWHLKIKWILQRKIMIEVNNKTTQFREDEKKLQIKLQDDVNYFRNRKNTNSLHIAYKKVTFDGRFRRTASWIKSKVTCFFLRIRQLRSVI